MLASRVPGHAVDLDLSPAPAPFVDFPGRLYLEGLFGRTPDDDPTFWLGRARGELVRFKGMLTLGAEAGRLHTFGLEGWYAAGGLSWRLR